MRALTLGELILLNRLRADEQLRRAIAMHGGGLTRHTTISAHATTIMETTMAPNGPVRVGFSGLVAYRTAAQGALDARADQLADRVDKIKERGLGTIGKHDKALDAQEGLIDAMEAMVREGSNDPAGQGPLGGS